ncbi:MAG: IS4 family transposase [Cytophagia bacterium]|nr:IS4 family transposase [Cytophagia bacterium]
MYFSESLSESRIETIARSTGFCKRKRKLSSVDFLSTLLFKEFDESKQSLNDHVIQLNTNHDTIIQKQSLDERFNKNASEFVRQVLLEQLSSSIQYQQLPALDFFSNVYLQDSTKFKLPHRFKNKYPGYHQAGASIQLTADIKKNNFTRLSIHPETYNDSNECENVDWLPKGSFLIRDLGYFSAKGFKSIEENESYFLSRLQPRSALFIKRGEEFIRFDIEKLLRRMKKYNIHFYDEILFMNREIKFPVRVCFFIVPKSIRDNRLRSKKKLMKGRGWNQSKEYSSWSWFNAYITNAGSDKISTEEIISFYKYRWQIELIFKTWKSNYRLGSMKTMKVERMECYLYALLLKTLLHRNIVNLYCNSISKDALHELDISVIKVTKLMIFFDKLIYKIICRVDGSIQMLSEALEKLDKSILKKEIKKKQVIFEHAGE